MDIAGQLCQVSIIFNQNTFIPALEQMSLLRMAQIENRCVGGAQPLHRFGEVGSVGSEQQVIVVFHQNEGDNVHLEALGQSRQRLKEGVAVLVRKENWPLVVATRKNVVICACIFDS